MIIIDSEFKFNRGAHSGRDIYDLLECGKISYLNWFLPRNKDHKLSDNLLKYLQSNINVTLDNKLRKLLSGMNNKLSKTFLDTISNPIHSKWDKIVISDGDMVNFKIPYTNKHGQIKISRLINNILLINGITPTTEQLEEFIDEYRRNIYCGEEMVFKIVRGDYIVKYYDVINYSPGSGTLNKSCMKHSTFSNRISFYPQNSIDMLTLFDSSGRVSGRALIWRDCKIENITGGEKYTGDFIDRVYTSKAKYKHLFYKWAQDNNFIIRSEFRRGSNEKFTIGGSEFRLKISKIVNKHGHEMPYLDTLNFNIKKYDNKILLSNFSNFN